MNTDWYTPPTPDSGPPRDIFGQYSQRFVPIRLHAITPTFRSEIYAREAEPSRVINKFLTGSVMLDTLLGTVSWPSMADPIVLWGLADKFTRTPEEVASEDWLLFETTVAHHTPVSRPPRP